jgi:hypothetical protein
VSRLIPLAVALVSSRVELLGLLLLPQPNLKALVFVSLLLLNMCDQPLLVLFVHLLPPQAVCLCVLLNRFLTPALSILQADTTPSFQPKMLLLIVLLLLLQPRHVCFMCLLPYLLFLSCHMQSASQKLTENNTPALLAV